MAILFPISFKSATPVEGIAKSANPSTLNFSFTESASSASATLNVTNTSGTTATSNTNVAFTLSTNNATGYTLRLKTTGGDTLVDSTNSNTSTNHIDPIGTDGITLDQFSNNTWGLLPSKYNGTNNTTNYYKPTTTGFKMDETTAPNTNNTANSYTVGLGIKADYTRPAGTYTNTTIVAEYVANQVSYAIYYDSNTTAEVNGMPSLNPQSGTVQDPTTAQNVTLASAPTRTGYTFSGWCLGTSTSPNITTTNGVDTCNSTKYDAGQQFGINAVDGTSSTNYNDTYHLYAMWTGNQYTATIYYNNKTSSGTSGATPSITSTQQTCRVTNTSNSCNITIPEGVRNSVGEYNNAYAGVSSSLSSMTAANSSTTLTLSATGSYYAFYRTTVTLYKPSSITAATSVTLYRNQTLSSTTAMNTTVLSNSTTGTSNWSYTRVAAASGTNPAFSLYGFNTATNSASRVSTCGSAGTSACSSIATLATSSHTTVYAIERVQISATFYYNNNTTTTSCTTAAVTSTTGSAYRYLYTTSTTAATVKNNNITVPTDVQNSKGTCGMTYKNVGTSTSNMTAATPNTSGATGSNTTVSSTYYTRYSGSVTNYYYSSSYTSRTIYRNQRVNGTSASSMSAIVLSTSATGTSNYSTATGPGTTASSWYGLAATKTTTRQYSSVSGAATASAVYSNLYTIYQFNITYSTTGSTGVSSIGSTSGSCRVTTSSTSCTVTLPAINVQSGYESLGWGAQGHTSAGTAAGSSYTLSSNGTTLYANAKISCTSTTFSGYMQDMAASTVTNACVGDSGTLTDRRDSSTYTVKKLADGNLWMTQNLALDLTALTQAQLYGTGTNAGKLTNASNTTLGYLKSGGGTTSDKYPTAKLNIVAWTGSSQDYYSIPMMVSSGTCNNAYCVNGGAAGSPWSYSDSTSVTINGVTSRVQGKIGIYYNYCAASAGSYCYGNGTSEGTSSGNASEDICPYGWRLPTGGSSGEFQALYTAYSSNYNNFVDALSTPLSGNFYSGTARNQGFYGSFWSSTRSSNYSMHILYVTSSSVDPLDYYNRFYGRSVRCVRTS